MNDKAPAVDPLDDLAAQASTLELPAGEGVPGEPVEEKAPDLTNAQCLLMGFEIMRETVCSFAGVLSPKETMATEKMQPVAEALGAVFDKYGVSLSGVAGDYMVEIKAAIVSVPVLLAIRSGLVLEMEASKKKAKKDGPELAVVVTDGAT